MTHESLQQAAIGVLKKDMGRVGKAGSRIHLDTAGDNAQRLRAINGVCGHCVNFKIEIIYQDCKERAVLRCTKGFSPLALYRKTELGQEARCTGFIKN